MATTIYVQFEDVAQTKVRAVFWAPQNPDIWPGIVVLQDDDSRYLEFLNPAPTPEQMLAASRVERDRLIAYATLKINPLQDSVDIDESTDEGVALLWLWKKYRSDLGSVETKLGWPEAPQWPIPPVELEPSSSAESA